jgi:hypothetical protein
LQHILRDVGVFPHVNLVEPHTEHGVRTVFAQCQNGVR